ncbi:MAG TPA: transglycosylase domain-containing protein [Xanthobacteraceae bacterium]|nr:transglycosylase domain-containing protein [Xanthobacteraceae bacterium]
MDTILVKIFATALALSEVLTQPHDVKTKFDPVADQAQVVQILRDGCTHMRQAFDIESINLDELISTALDDPKAVGANAAVFHGISFSDLNTAYHQFCKNEPIDKPVVDLGQVIDFFDEAATDLPQQAELDTLKNKKLPSMSTLYDGTGGKFADIYQPGNRRIWIALSNVPDFVQKAFIAAEDQRFYQHHGIDERGIIRAFIGNLANPGRPEGGSTITQQVVKNLLVGDDITYQRKIREMIVASRLENTLSKSEILQLYLNSVYMGRGAWGIEMAARSYFGKSAKDLTLSEAAILAGLLKGPSYYNPDLHPQRAKERLTYVLDRMKDDGFITAEQKDQALAAPPKLVDFTRPHRDSGFAFADFVGREAKLEGVDSLTAAPYIVHTTINAQLQRQTEAALQEGLAKYEISMGRMAFHGPEANIADAVQKLASAQPTGKQPDMPAWQQALLAVRLPLYDVHWTPAVVLDKGGKKGDGAIHVGLPDGRLVPLTTYTSTIRRNLSLYDVIYVNVVEPKAAPAVPTGKRVGRPRPAATARAEIRVRPTVQGAALVLENKTGRILAMAGGFSYPLSQLNRTWQTERQPGSAIKPITYLTALQKGLQPNTLILDDPITLPPVGSGLNGQDVIALGDSNREDYYWTPRNYGDQIGGIYTLRRGLEHSVNIVTAHLLDGGIDPSPETSLDDICATAVAAKIYSDCVRYYPFVLGAQPVRMIDLAAFYAAVANEGTRPQPHAIDSIDLDGKTVFAYPKSPLFPRIGAADPASFYQLKSILQGVVARGTARAIGQLSPYVAGKTGTTEDSVDGWFVGFTNDVTIAVWVGYDNGNGKRRSLGPVDGARVALPIFEPIIDDVWADNIAPKVPLAGPSPEARRNLVDVPIDYMSGDRVSGGRGNFIEHFRIGPDGEVADTQNQLVSREEAAERETEDANAEQGSPGEYGGYYGGYYGGGRGYYANRGWQQEPPQPPPPSPWHGFFGNWGPPGYQSQPQPVQPQPSARGLFTPQSNNPYYGGPPRPARDPDYFWGGHFD